MAPTPPREVRRLVFLGTPGVAVPTLAALHEAGYEIPLVITGADKRRGRGGAVSPTPVKAAALERGLAVSHRLNDLADVEADLGVVVAYGQIIPAPLLEAVPLINIHFSLLPRWRGAAPVERALLAGDDETGVCIMAIEETLDTGAVYARASHAIGPTDTLDTLRDALVGLGTVLLLDSLAHGLPRPEPQQGEISYAAKIDPTELEIDWHRPAVEIDRLVRVGGAWTTSGKRRLKVRVARPTAAGPAPGVVDELIVGTGQGGLQLIEVQPEGKGPRAAEAWANGARIDGEQLGR